MAETVGNINVVITINTKGYDAGKKHIKKGNAELEKSADKSSKAFGSAWSGAIAGVAASITGRLVGAISSATGDMTALYDASIKFPKVLTTMGATGEFAADSFNSMKKYADETIYSLDNMTKTFGSLYGITGDMTGELVTALGGVSTLAANAGQAMDSWSLQLTQMVAKPMIAWQDFRILLEQNPAAIAKIAESMGKNSSDIIKDVQNGTLATEDFLDALKDVGNDKGLQEAATASDTFGNSMGQLDAAIASAGAKFLDVFGPTIVEIINKTATAFDVVSDEVIKVIGYISDHKDVFGTLAAGIGGVVTALTAWNIITKAMAVSQAALNAVLAANPIGIIITAVAALVAGLVYFFTQTEIGKKIWQNVMNFLSKSISNIVAAFQKAWDSIKRIFSAVGGFFRGVWNTIKNTFTTIGSAIGNAIGGAFKNVVNSILNFAENTINGFIRSINTAIGAINKIPGVNIGQLGLLNIPRLAEGGIVPQTPGGRLVVAGEGNDDEAVIPLHNLESMVDFNNGSNETQDINLSLNLGGLVFNNKSDKRAFANEIGKLINEVSTANIGKISIEGVI